jgi:DNA mismatch endonuclease (patch repair protein)
VADRFDRATRSRIMARIRPFGTRLEGRVGALLREEFPGEEIAERPRGLPGRPDFFLPRLRLAVFADGCFFHGCPRCFRLPDSNKEFWARKIGRNRERDRRVVGELRRMGIRTARIWEHEAGGRAREARRKLRRAAKRAAKGPSCPEGGANGHSAPQGDIPLVKIAGKRLKRGLPGTCPPQKGHPIAPLGVRRGTVREKCPGTPLCQLSRPNSGPYWDSVPGHF